MDPFGASLGGAGRFCRRTPPPVGATGASAVGGARAAGGGLGAAHGRCGGAAEAVACRFRRESEPDAERRFCGGADGCGWTAA